MAGKDRRRSERYPTASIPCLVLRSVVQVRRADNTPEYVFRSAIQFSPIPREQEATFHEFLELQMARLREKQRELESR